MGISCNPPRQPGQLPPTTDDIMFLNRSGSVVGQLKCTFTDTTANPPQSHQLIEEDIDRNALFRTRLVQQGVDISANQVVVEIRYDKTSPNADFTLNLAPLSGTDVRCVCMGLMRVFLSPTSTDVIPYCEMIKGTGDGEAID